MFTNDDELKLFTARYEAIVVLNLSVVKYDPIVLLKLAVGK